MAEIKWIKIDLGMFDDEKIKLIDALPDRDTIFNIWMKLLIQAGKYNNYGHIMLSENIPYTDEMLSTIFNRPLNSIRLALQTLKSFGMIDIDESNLIVINNWCKHQNIEGMDKIREQNRLRKQKERERKKQLNDVTGQSRDSHAIELEEEREEEIDNSSSSSSTPDGDHPIDSVDNMEYVLNHLKLSGFENVEGINNHIEGYIETYSTDWVIAAIDESVKRGKRTLKYIEGILKNWNSEGGIKFEKDKPKKKPQSKKNAPIKYSNQREYDVDELKKQLLGR